MAMVEQGAKAWKRKAGTRTPAFAGRALLGIDEARASRLVAFSYSPTRNNAAA